MRTQLRPSLARLDQSQGEYRDFPCLKVNRQFEAIDDSDCIIKRIWSLIGLPSARASISYKSVATHFGACASAADISHGSSLYANIMYAESGKAAQKRPPGVFAFRESSGKLSIWGTWLRLTVEDSNDIVPPAAVCHAVG